MNWSHLPPLLCRQLVVPKLLTYLTHCHLALLSSWMAPLPQFEKQNAIQFQLSEYLPPSRPFKCVALALQENRELQEFFQWRICFTINKFMQFLCFLVYTINFSFQYQVLVSSLEDILHSRSIQPLQCQKCTELDGSEDTWMATTKFIHSLSITKKS